MKIKHNKAHVLYKALGYDLNFVNHLCSGMRLMNRKKLTTWGKFEIFSPLFASHLNVLFGPLKLISVSSGSRNSVVGAGRGGGMHLPEICSVAFGGFLTVSTYTT